MKVFFAITCYDHKIYGECSESILKNSISLMKEGHSVTPYFSNDLYIDRSRNVCVNLFLDSDCTDLIFVDADLSFDDDAILKLLKYDKDIVAGVYPYKKPQLEFPATLKFDKQNNCKEEETGLVYATRVPTGLMRIQRRVFENFLVEKDERGIGQYFKTGMVFKDDPNWWGEDAYFCRKCIELGFEIYIEPRITFTHYGMQGFKGNYHEYLMGRQIDVLNLDEVSSGIKGWTTEKELKVLDTLAAQSESVVEIGSWKGRSTKALLDACKGTVYAVDIWKVNDIFQEFFKNVGYYKNLVVYHGDSLEVAKDFDKKVDMAFIDADHSYEAVKADIEAWMPKCKKFICGHDYDFPNVKRAVNEKFDNVEVIDTLWIKRL